MEGTGNTKGDFLALLLAVLEGTGNTKGDFLALLVTVFAAAFLDVFATGALGVSFLIGLLAADFLGVGLFSGELPADFLFLTWPEVPFSPLLRLAP